MAKVSSKPPKRDARPAAAQAEPRWRPSADLWISLGLLLVAALIYAQTASFDFVNFDDPDYVANNLHVRYGLSPAGIAWAFTSGEAANWFPLTWLSHMLDCSLFGLRSGLHHLTNLLWHGLATLLLFAMLRRSTGARWRSAFVALVFAAHPLHVESVAWVAERKDVLSAFFWFLAMWAYVRYVEQPGAARYAAVAAALACGLMAKPMLVTLPFVLLLWDLWPLRREGWHVREKLPLLALSAVAAVTTFFVQRAGGAVQDTESLPLALRVENALVSYCVYLAKTFWPSKLAVFYPYPDDIPAWQAALAAGVLAGASIAAVWRRRAYPYLFTGWFWFLGTLVPVIGLVQVGAQARADRYMYVPMVGVLLIVAWGAVDAARQWRLPRPALAAAAAAACAALAGTAWAQTRYWRDNETLFRHALAVTQDNYIAHHNLGTYLMDKPGRLPEAVEQLEAAVRTDEDSESALTDLATALARVPGRLEEAIKTYRAALALDPTAPIPHNNLGNALARVPSKLPEAIAEYETALRLKPDYAEAHNNLGAALSQTPGRAAEARAQFEEALRLRPDYEQARRNLELLSNMSRPAGANSAEAHYEQGLALSKSGRFAEAVAEFEAALRLKPGYAEAHNNLGAALASMGGHGAEALSHFQAAARLDPNNADAHYNLGIALAEMPGRTAEAIAQFEEVERLRPDPEVRKVIARLRAERQ